MQVYCWMKNFNKKSKVLFYLEQSTQMYFIFYNFACHTCTLLSNSASRQKDGTGTRMATGN